jgi:hypothetical protein
MQPDALQPNALQPGPKDKESRDWIQQGPGGGLIQGFQPNAFETGRDATRQGFQVDAFQSLGFQVSGRMEGAIPVITDQTQDTQIRRKDSITLSVTATGTLLTYQWYEGIYPDTSLPVSSSDTVTVTPLGDTVYWCRVLSNGIFEANTGNIFIAVSAGGSGLSIRRLKKRKARYVYKAEDDQIIIASTLPEDAELVATEEPLLVPVEPDAPIVQQVKKDATTFDDRQIAVSIKTLLELQRIKDEEEEDMLRLFVALIDED